MRTEKMTPLFDTSFQAHQKRRTSKALHPIIKTAQDRLHDRLADLKEACPHKFSCFDLQAQNDLPSALHKIHDSLPEGGIFLGVMAGGESLRELKTCLTKAEHDLTGSNTPRIAPMVSLEDLSKLLPPAGFTHTAGDVERFNLIYTDMIMLMHDLRGTGFTNSLMTRSRRFTSRKVFERAHEIYKEHYTAPEGGIVATLDLLYMHGWKSPKI